MPDWVDLSFWQSRRLSLLKSIWEPTNWDTTVIDFDKLVGASEGVIIRLGDGLKVDPTFSRYRAELVKRGAIWAFYHDFHPEVPPGTQVELCLTTQAQCPPAGVYSDMELKAGTPSAQLYFDRADMYLRGLDAGYEAETGIYSGSWFLDPLLPRTLQVRWGMRKGWWSGYPSLLIPSGWAGADPPYVLHQYTNKKVWPGLPNPADASERNPAVPLSALVVRGGGVTYPPMKRGTQMGFHAESSSQAVPIARKYKAAGVQISAILAHENPGLCVDMKAIDPNILTIARWANPNKRWEGGQDVFSWSPEERRTFAQMSIQLIFDRTNDDEYRASDYFCPGLNEWDPPEFNGDGYKAEAEVMKLLIEEAAIRSPEMTSRGLHPIRLALPGFNSGTPEWNEIQAWKATGVEAALKAGGHIRIHHEGAQFNHPIEEGFGDLIPGAPRVPPYAGSLCGRVNYWESDVPFVITEWYDGWWEAIDPATRLLKVRWYDAMIRHNPLCRGWCLFELTDDVASPWYGVNFTEMANSQITIDWMRSEKDAINPTKEDDVPDVNDADFAELVDATAQAGSGNARVSAVLAKYKAKAWYSDLPLGVLSPARTLAAPGKALTIYNRAGVPFAPQPLLDAAGKPRGIAWTMSATEHVVVGGVDLLRVLDQAGTDNDWYVRASEVAQA